MKCLIVLICLLVLSKCYGGLIKPSQENEGNLDWYKTTILYQIYPRSFKDSNNDGIGDLQGITQKLDYLASLGVGAIWISPINPSPLADMGYDVSDYRAIAPEYGTLDDFRELIAVAHKNGIKVLLDFVPNHTSDDHLWFNSSAFRTSGYEDYYVWADGKVDEDGNKLPPNNWLSSWEGSAWTWHETRQQYYLHQYGVRQPDLNYRSDRVQQEIRDIWTYWLDMGVDGFRIDAITKAYEDEHLRDEPKINNNNDYNSLDHVYTKDQDETFELVYSWRKFLDDYTAANGGDARIMVTEASTSMRNVTRYYGNSTSPGAHFSFNFLIFSASSNWNAGTLYDNIKTWVTSLPQDLPNNWLTGSHDNRRVASRVGTNFIDGYNMLILFLRGATVTYQGEEIGQEDGAVTCEEGQDPRAIEDCSTYNQRSRDFERTPFQWDNTTNAGFNTGAKPWLPVSSKYVETNLESEIFQKNSHYNVYKQMAEMKEEFNSYEKMEYNTAEVNGVLRVKLSKEDHANEYYELIYNLREDNYVPGLKDFALVVHSGGFVPGESLILQPADCVVIKASA
ncbi:maltase 2-like [Euwallacea fornicatus]|uniref:maltase 2-like n=1 Tax=Euwallacea fornicatus TaxID=995702 RepID=UPI00338E2F49